MTSHDDDFVRDYASRVVVLANGVVVEEGDPRMVLETPSASGDEGTAAGWKPRRKDMSRVGIEPTTT